LVLLSTFYRRFAHSRLALEPMSWSTLVARKILTGPQQSFSKFIIRLSVAATGFSVAAMLVTLCLVNGFQHTVSQKVYSFWGHIHVKSYEQAQALVTEETPFETSNALLQLIRTTPNVAHVQPFATKSAILKKGENFSGILLKGVDPQFDKTQFQSFMRQGSFLDFSDTLYSRQILLSAQVANMLQVQTGDTLQAYFLRRESNIQFRNLVVTGIYRSGIEEYDQNFALADIRLLQRMNLWDAAEIGGYEVWVNNLKGLNTTNDSLYNRLPQGLNSLTIQQQYPSIFDWLSVQHQTKWIVVVVMGIVAFINLITFLLIIVLDRTRMIGLLQSLGAGNGSIRRIFLWYGTYISLLGIGLGSLLGLGIAAAEYFLHFIKMDEATYYVAYAPVAFDWLQTAGVVLGTALLCFLVLIIPSFFVSRITPVKALRFR
jgi:lipoprotein-releasing system permease protein